MLLFSYRTIAYLLTEQKEDHAYGTQKTGKRGQLHGD